MSEKHLKLSQMKNIFQKLFIKSMGTFVPILPRTIVVRNISPSSLKLKWDNLPSLTK